MHLIQQLKLWKALDFSGESFFNCCKRLMHFFLKPGLGISCKNRKHMFADTFLLSFLGMPWSSHSCNDRRYSYSEIFAIDMLTVLKSFLEHDCKHVLRLSRLFLDGDPPNFM